MKRRSGFGSRAFTVVELLVGASIAILIVGSLLTASISLQRGFSAAADQSGAQRDQMRVIDYVTRDLRRAASVTVSNGGAKLTLAIPDHHDALVFGIRVPTISPNGVVTYGTPRTVSYFIEGAAFLRVEEGKEKVIADTVEEFHVSHDNASKVTFRIGFSPHFSWRHRANPGAATLSSTVFLRNAQRPSVL